MTVKGGVGYDRTPLLVYTIAEAEIVMDQKAIEKSYSPLEVEEKWYAYWISQGLFDAADASEKPSYCIVIPPPNVTGILHMGHALNNTLQDIIIRFKRMKGFNTLWMPGTDHAGIATQNVVEQELAKSGTTRHDIGREKFLEEVWRWREKYGGIIINQLQKLGCSCDWSRERFTMDDGLSRAVREVFVRLYEDGYIYQGDYIVNWCPRCHTALSDLEVEYEETHSYLWYVKYPYVNAEGGLIVATTRPETMLGDTAVAVNPKDDRYAASIGKKVILPLVNKEIPVIADEYVSKEFGTGAVKITPACDPNDFLIAERHDLDIVVIMDGNAVINENGGKYKGQSRDVCRKNMIEDLKEGGYLVREEPYVHNVGKCYRCKTVVEPSVSKQWFVRMKPLARDAISAVIKGETKIIPKSWEGTYFEWLENIRDWCISRQIWWGHRIPVWYCENCHEVIVSRTDPSSCTQCGGSRLRQDEDVLDTWFSSALWPFSTLGWPDQTVALSTFYPTSLLITGFDIIFFWVARMIMMGLYFMKEVPFSHVYLHALVRDEKGEKMSKSKGNSIDPLAMIEKYGADAFRFTLAAFAAQGRDVKMSEARIEGYRHFVNKIWNTARFALMNMEDNSDGIQLQDDIPWSLADRWIRHRLNQTAKEVTLNLEEYRFNDAAMSVYQFFWHEFCDWYVEMIKPSLYRHDSLQSGKTSRRMLRSVLMDSLKLLHPFMPFVTEEIWQRIGTTGQTQSIMRTSFPQWRDDFMDSDAEYKVSIIKDIVTSVRNVRGVMNIPYGKKLNVSLSITDKTIADVVHSVRDYIVHLANLDDMDIAKDERRHAGAVMDVVGSIKVFVYLGGMIDIEAEKVRLEKKLSKVTKEHTVVSNKLNNKDFIDKASQEIIVKEQMKFEELKHQRTVIGDALKKLQEIGR